MKRKFFGVYLLFFVLFLSGCNNDYCEDSLSLEGFEFYENELRHLVLFSDSIINVSYEDAGETCFNGVDVESCNEYYVKFNDIDNFLGMTLDQIRPLLSCSQITPKQNEYLKLLLKVVEHDKVLANSCSKLTTNIMYGNYDNKSTILTLLDGSMKGGNLYISDDLYKLSFWGRDQEAIDKGLDELMGNLGLVD